MDSLPVGQLPDVLSPWVRLMSRSARSPVVLVVDSRAVIRNLLELALFDAGFEVCTGGTGAEALATALAVSPFLDAVILDVRHLGERSPEVLQALRALVPTLPCCLIAGDPDEPSEELRAEGGAVRVFPRRFPIDRLVTTVRELVASHRGEDAPTSEERAGRSTCPGGWENWCSQMEGKN